MRIERCEIRPRSGAEVAFAIMRVLATARLLWGGRGALPIDALPALATVPAEKIAVALDQLCEEGIATVCGDGTTVRLTELGAREIARRNLG